MGCLSGKDSQAGKSPSALGACLNGRPLRGIMSLVETARLFMGREDEESKRTLLTQS